MTQPEALRLTQVAPYLEGGERGQWIVAAAAELRRLHEINQELLALLKECIHFVEYDPGNVIGKKARAAIAKGEAK
jgi:hypothetical protein